MSLALNLNSQIQHIRRDRFSSGKSSRIRGKGLVISLALAMAVLFPLAFLYMLTDPHGALSRLHASDRPSGMTLEQYASSPIPAPAPKEYLGS